MVNPPITDNDLSEWRAEATAERRRAGLKNLHAFRVQVLVEEVARLRTATERDAKLLEEQRARTAAAERREKHLAEVRDRQRNTLVEVTNLYRDRESAKHEVAARVAMAKIAIALVTGGWIDASEVPK